MKLHFKYTNYPASPKLTEKSRRVGTLTHPIYGFALGGLLLFVSAFVFSKSVAVPMILGLGGIVVFPLLLLFIRKKKFAQYDAEYKKLLKRMEKQ